MSKMNFFNTKKKFKKLNIPSWAQSDSVNEMPKNEAKIIILINTKDAVF